MRRSASLIVLVLSSVAASQTLPSAKTWIPLMVENGNHEAVTNLDQASLTAKYGKSQVADLQLVSAANFPLRLGVLIDVSGSEKSRDFASLVDHVKDFALEALQKPEDRVFFATFNDERAATGWLTREQIKLLSGSPKTGGGTAIYDAVVSACVSRMGLVDWSNPTRRVLIIFSDGEDNASNGTLQAAVKTAQQNSVVIFSFDTSFPSISMRGDKTMEELANLTGGKLFSGFSDKDADKALSQLRQFLNGMYFAGFQVTEDRGKARDLEVKSTGNEKMEILYPKKHIVLP